MSTYGVSYHSSNEIKVEELYTEVGLEKEKWLEIIDILRNKEIIK